MFNVSSGIVAGDNLCDRSRAGACWELLSKEAADVGRSQNDQPRLSSTILCLLQASTSGAGGSLVAFMDVGELAENESSVPAPGRTAAELLKEQDRETAR